MPKTYCYMRVSSTKKSERQTTKSQEKALRDYARQHGYRKPIMLSDFGSGKRANRKQWKWLLDNVKEGDRICCWKLDRCSRSTLDMLKTIQFLLERKVTLIITSNNLTLDGTNPFNQMFVELLSVIASFESSLISDRILAGLACTNKKPTGRPIDQKKHGRLQKLINQDMPVSQIAKRLKVNRSSVYTMIRRMKKVA